MTVCFWWSHIALCMRCPALPQQCLRAGYNANSQIGDGSSTNQQAPVPVATISGIASTTFLAAGRGHSCVAVDYGREAAMCWGCVAACIFGELACSQPDAIVIQLWLFPANVNG